MNTQQTKPKKVPQKTTLITPNSLYELVYNKEQGKTSFIKIDSSGAIESDIQEVVIGDQKYHPLSPSNHLIVKSVVHFADKAEEYSSDAQLVNEIHDFVHKYVQMSETFEWIATYYVLFTWMYDKFNEVAYLRAIGDFGSGKSRFLQVIGSICYKPTFAGGATTTSPIFRVIDDICGTFVMDEADFANSDMTKDIVKILNTGYQRGVPVWRTEGKEMDVRTFDVFCPKIIAARETYSDVALESRFLTEQMGTLKLRADIPRSLSNTFRTEAQTLQNKLLMWRLKNYFTQVEMSTEIIEGIHPRLNQIVAPLLTLIHDEKTKQDLREFISEANKDLLELRGLRKESDILSSIFRLKDAGSNVLTMKEIADDVNENSDADDDWVMPRKIGWFLRKTMHLKTHKSRRGYTLDVKENDERLNILKDRYGLVEETE